MKPGPPDATAPRRHRSRQRERILAWLRSTDRHPTAPEIHEALRSEMPTLSLGTVYRNLDVLVAEGLIDEVASGPGATRYDGNVEPHHHFRCERCGRILDVDLPSPRALARRLADEHGLSARRIRISFLGDCPGCEARRKSPEQRAAMARPSKRRRITRKTRRECNG